MSIWNLGAQDALVVVAVDPPEDAEVGTLWGDLGATGFVHPDGTREEA